MSQMPRLGAPRWQQVMWSGAGISLLLTIVILLSFAVITVSQLINVISKRSDADLGFIFASIGVITQTLLRLLAILVGAAVAFTGLAVSFFAHEHESTASAHLGDRAGGSAKFALATHVPGVFGVVVGALVIVAALYARGTHEYTGPEIRSTTQPKPEAAPSQSEPASNSTVLPPVEEVLKTRKSNPAR